MEVGGFLFQGFLQGFYIYIYIYITCVYIYIHISTVRLACRIQDIQLVQLYTGSARVLARVEVRA